MITAEYQFSSALLPGVASLCRRYWMEHTSIQQHTLRGLLLACLSAKTPFVTFYTVEGFIFAVKYSKNVK